jgi:hypothetical protein
VYSWAVGQTTVESHACLNDVSHFLLGTRWLIPPSDMFITDEPWFPDWHVRLFRRDDRLIIYPEQIHEPLLIRARNSVMGPVDRSVLSREQLAEAT